MIIFCGASLQLEVARVVLCALGCAAPLWTKVDSTVYSLTYVMGFVVTGAFVLLFLLLIIFQGAVREHHSRGRQTQYTEGGLSFLHLISNT